ncbi:MAG: hypothetical protein LBK60_10495 [Verrucomicrobiales bacterium]|jgi:hypothetical protein|nr:hypothetical protein [Verrucomicrobiales bacterium]
MSGEKKKDPWLPPDLWLATGIPLIVIGALTAVLLPLILWCMQFDWVWLITIFGGIALMVGGITWLISRKNNR